MTALITRVERGDKFVWRQDNDPDVSIYVEVTRVARDGSWADIHCHTWGAFWTKRQRMPLPSGCRRHWWTSEDLDREAEAHAKGSQAAADGRRYFLAEYGANDFREVTKAEFVAAERRCGFNNAPGKDGEPATSGFGIAGGTQGRVEFSAGAA